MAVCRNCGESIRFDADYDEWMHGNEPLCGGVTTETLRLAIAGRGVYAEPIL